MAQKKVEYPKEISIIQDDAGCYIEEDIESYQKECIDGETYAVYKLDRVIRVSKIINLTTLAKQ